MIENKLFIQSFRAFILRLSKITLLSKLNTLKNEQFSIAYAILLRQDADQREAMPLVLIITYAAMRLRCEQIILRTHNRNIPRMHRLCCFDFGCANIKHKNAKGLKTRRFSFQNVSFSAPHAWLLH